METSQLSRRAMAANQSWRTTPVVSLILPFEPKMTDLHVLENYLEQCLTKANDLLKSNCPRTTCETIQQKLRELISQLDFHTHKKSIAIVATIMSHKIVYLDMPVEETISIGPTFHLRQMIETKPRTVDYLVLRLNARVFHIYVVNTNTIRKIVSDPSQSLDAYMNDIPEKIGNFTDASSRREVLMDKFIHHIDNTLGIILNAYHLPVVVVGPERMAGHFRSITSHPRSIFQYIHHNTTRLSDADLLLELHGNLKNPECLASFNLISALEEAADKKMISAGIEEVANTALAHQGRILLIEKSFGKLNHPHDEERQVMDGTPHACHNESELIDNAINAVLSNGGQVEIVDDNALDRYKHIALIKYY